MQCKMLVVSSELEERSDMRESREIKVVIWVLEKCSMKVVSGGMAELHFKHTLSPKIGVVRSLKKL